MFYDKSGWKWQHYQERVECAGNGTSIGGEGWFYFKLPIS